MAVSIFRANTPGWIGAQHAIYATAHDANTGTVAEAGAQVIRNNFEDSDSTYRVGRGFVNFTTSGLGTISAARFFFRSNGRNEDNTGQSRLYLVRGIQGVPLVDTDFGDHLGYTASGGSIVFADMGQYPTAAGQNTITLNSTGRGWISATTKFCLRVSGDINNSAPTDTGSDVQNHVLLDWGGGWVGVVTDAATNVAGRTATLNGTSIGSKWSPPLLEITHDGSNPTYPRCRFQYGTTTAYGTNTDWQSGVAVFEAFTANITGLELETTYHFRAVLEDTDGTENGDDATFTTIIDDRVTGIVIREGPGYYTDELHLGGLSTSWRLVDIQKQPTPAVPSEYAEPTAGPQVWSGPFWYQPDLNLIPYADRARAEAEGGYWFWIIDGQVTRTPPWEAQ